jgi:type II secretory pathway component GspD/PulD (secretin)
MKRFLTHTRLLFLLAAGFAILFPLPAVFAEDAPAQPAAEAPPPPPPGPADIRQVQVQVWISETNEQGLRNIGNNLDFTRFVQEDTFNGPVWEEQGGAVPQAATNMFTPGDYGSVVLPAPIPPAGANFEDQPLRPDPNNNRNDGIAAISGFGMEYSIANDQYGTINGLFRALETKVDVDLISKPELLVVNGGTAEIKAGGQIPYQTVKYPKGTPNLSIEWRDIGVNLKLQPTIMPNDFVQLHLQQLEVSDITRIENLRGVDLPVFSKRAQTGFVLVPSGQTLVIGGLSSRVVRKTERRVPLVGRLPVLGMPFRSRNSEADITHLLIFVSPTIVDLRAPSKAGLSALEFWKERGSEWSNIDRIEQEIEIMREEL